MSLAREFGHVDVDRMLASIPAAAITEWIAFYQLEAEDRDTARTKAKTEAGAAARAKKAIRK